MGHINRELPAGVPVHTYHVFLRFQYTDSVNNYQHASTGLSAPINIHEIAPLKKTSNSQFNTIVLACIVGGFVFISAFVIFLFRKKKSMDKPYASGIQVRS